MSMTHAELAERIIESAGGPANITSAGRCRTRLRLAVRDAATVRDDELQAIDEVVALHCSGTELEILVGAHLEGVSTAVDRPLGAAAVQILSPVRGAIVPLEAIPDAVFAAGVMGPGLGVEPECGEIVAPVSGTVMAATDTGHAFGIVTDDGVEVLVHIGIDTVRLKGRGFDHPVEQGTRIAAGRPLVTVDLPTLRAEGYPATVVVVVTNPEKVGPVQVVARGPVDVGAPVFTVGAPRQK